MSSLSDGKPVLFDLFLIQSKFVEKTSVFLSSHGDLVEKCSVFVALGFHGPLQSGPRFLDSDLQIFGKNSVFCYSERKILEKTSIFYESDPVAHSELQIVDKNSVFRYSERNILEKTSIFHESDPVAPESVPASLQS